MAELTFRIVDIAPEPYAAAPALLAKVRIETDPPAQVHALALRAQVRIEPKRRPYTDAEADGLLDLFDTRDRWSATQRSLLWMHASTMVQGFSGASETNLPLPCSYDFEVTASKFLHALDTDGAPIPLEFLFSGTVFFKQPDGFSIAQVPWDREARYAMPVQVWHELIQTHYPGAGWLRVDHDVAAALVRFKARRGLLDVGEAITELLSRAQEPIP